MDLRRASVASDTISTRRQIYVSSRLRIVGQIRVRAFLYHSVPVEGRTRHDLGNGPRLRGLTGGNELQTVPHGVGFGLVPTTNRLRSRLAPVFARCGWNVQ